ncbi:MAG: ABC transporter substrate-binding protein, partial [Candidatus Methanospirareceae archaeon]
TFADEIIEIAGGKNIAAADGKTGYFIMSLEELIEKNPQVIICDSGMGEMSFAYEQIMNDERLKNLDAVKNNRVYVIDGDIISRPGPRVVEAVEIVHQNFSDFFAAVEDDDNYKTVEAGEEAVVKLEGEDDYDCLDEIRVKAGEEGEVKFTSISVEPAQQPAPTSASTSAPASTSGPAPTSSLALATYKCFALSAEDLEGSVEWVRLNFSVSKSWLAAKPLNPQAAAKTVSLFRYDDENETWAELNTSETGTGGESSEKVFYTARSPSFGTFAICAALETRNETEGSPTPTPAPTPSAAAVTPTPRVAVTTTPRATPSQTNFSTAATTSQKPSQKQTAKQTNSSRAAAAPPPKPSIFEKIFRFFFGWLLK